MLDVRVSQSTQPERDGVKDRVFLVKRADGRRACVALVCSAHAKPRTIQSDSVTQSTKQIQKEVLYDDVAGIHPVNHSQLWGWACSFLDAPVRFSTSVDIALWGESIDRVGQGPRSVDGEAARGMRPESPPEDSRTPTRGCGPRGRRRISSPGRCARTQCDEDFNKAITTALNAASATCQIIKPSACGRYRILNDGQPIAKLVTGGSAGGAAFSRMVARTPVQSSRLGTHRANHLDGARLEIQLGGVNGLREKSKAIVNLGRHDTIAVANATDARIVSELLQRSTFTTKPAPRVVDLSQPEASAPTRA